MREVLQRVGILVRVGMHWGHTVVHRHPLTSCTSMIGANVQGAVRLARLAKPRAVLIAVELRYHPKVEQDRFVFIQQQRRIRTDRSRPAAPQTLSCYVMTLVAV